MTELVVKPRLINKIMLYVLLAFSALFLISALFGVVAIVATAFTNLGNAIVELLLVILAAGILVFAVLMYSKSAVKKLIFTAEGCTVEFVGKSEFYSWSEIIVRRLDTIEGSFGRTINKGICFSADERDRDPARGFSERSIFPRTNYFCVYLMFEKYAVTTISTGPWKKQNNYLVDENTLMTALREWGVDYDLA